MAEIELNLHPEAKAFFEATKSLWEGFASAELKSVEKFRSLIEDVAKAGGLGSMKDYEGTREEIFVESKEVEGQINASFSTFPFLGHF